MRISRLISVGLAVLLMELSPAVSIGAVAASASGDGAAKPAVSLPAAAPAAQGTFVSFSDFHFNPFFDPSLVTDLVRTEAGRWQSIFERSTITSVGGYGTDSNYMLLKSTLAAARELAPEPDFVFISGDFLGHNFPALFAKYAPRASRAAYRRFVRHTMQFVTDMIRQAYPRARIIAALGNNDSDCGDYELRGGSQFLASLGQLWRPLLGPVPKSFGWTFSSGGFFRVPHPTVPHLQVVVLNTVLFSPKYKICGHGRDMREPELRWLDSTLRDASRRGDKVWLLYHIPPGIDAYATLHAKGPCRDSAVSLWRPGDQDRFWRILGRYSGVVTAAFAGHTHMDEIRLSEGASFIHVTPAVSPLFGNNPGFVVFSYAKDNGRIADARTYYLDLAASGDSSAHWALEYDFAEAYAQPAIDGQTVEAVQKAIGDDTAIRDRYLTYYPVSSASSSTDLAHWLAYWCATKASTPDTFVECYCPAAQPGQ